jgi:pimeloyl-ACP methyl ester carboxylesterase
MSSSSIPTLLIKGTFAPLRASNWYYRDIIGITSPCLPTDLLHIGAAHTRESCHHIHRFAEKRCVGQRRRLWGHSQGALVAAWLFANHPERYEPPILVAGPVKGSQHAPVWLPILSSIRCMATVSRFLEELRAQLADLPSERLSQIVTISADGDWAVPPTCAFIPGARNFCIAPSQRHPALAVELPGVELVEGRSNHLKLPFSPFVHRLTKEAFGSALVAA